MDYWVPDLSVLPLELWTTDSYINCFGSKVSNDGIFRSWIYCSVWCHNENGYAFSYDEDNQVCMIAVEQQIQIANETTNFNDIQTVFISQAGR